MKKLLVFALIIVCCVAFAGIKSVEGYDSTVNFVQFTYNDLNTGNYTNVYKSDQNWLGAQEILLNINSEVDLYFSNYVSSWYWPKPLTALDGNIYDMGLEQYGVFNAEKTWYGTGDTRTVTFYDDATGVTNQTEAYYVGHFQGGETVALFMTTLPADGAETIDSIQYVNDANHSTVLWSRLDGTQDLAGNVRINFGLEDYIAHEFIAFGVSDQSAPPSGQPLPGTFATLAIAGSCISIAYKRRKKN